MSGGGKKKSGFQITSVTSDYEQQQQQQQQREGLASPTPPGGGGGGGDAGKKGPGGGSSSSSPRVARGGPAPGEEGDPGGGGGGEEEEEEEEGGGGKRANGGGSVSAGGAPNGPSGPPACSGVVVSAVSRFRVVKLDQGSGEPYKRGRWTCRDFYEPEAEPLLAAWAAASAAGRLAAASTASDRERQPHSLDSRLEAAAGLLLAKTPQGPFSPQPQRRGPPLAAAAPALHQHHQPQHHQHQQHHRLLHLPGGPGAPGYSQARSLGGLPGLLRPPAAPPSPGTLRSPLAAAPDALRPPGAPQETPSGGDTPAPPPGLIPTLVVEEPRLPNKKSVAQLIRGEADEPRRKVSSPRQSRSRPSSPAPPLFRDASPSRRTSDPFGAARFSLAQSMFGMGVAPHDSDDDSGTNSSLIAIDNKIEQAMDLVKSHLMFAVREEVEVLREQIKELSERNASLEQENALLRSLASAEQLGRFQAQFHAATKPSSSGGSSSSGGESSSSTTTTTTTTTA